MLVLVVVSYVFSSRRYFVLSGSNLSYFNGKGEREARDNMVLTSTSTVTEMKSKGAWAGRHASRRTSEEAAQQSG